MLLENKIIRISQFDLGLDQNVKIFLQTERFLEWAMPGIGSATSAV